MKMERRSFNDPTGRIIKIINDLGLDDYVQVSVMGRMVKIRLVYDPLHQERGNLRSLKSKLLRSRNSYDSIGKHLIQQVDYFLDRIDQLSLNKVIISVLSSDGIQRLEEQLTSIHREMEDRSKKAREMRKIVRSMSSYIREYLRNTGRA